MYAGPRPRAILFTEPGAIDGGQDFEHLCLEQDHAWDLSPSDFDSVFEDYKMIGAGSVGTALRSYTMLGVSGRQHRFPSCSWLYPRL